MSTPITNTSNSEAQVNITGTYHICAATDNKLYNTRRGKSYDKVKHPQITQN